MSVIIQVGPYICEADTTATQFQRIENKAGVSLKCQCSYAVQLYYGLTYCFVIYKMVNIAMSD